MLRQLQRSYGNSYVGAVIQRKGEGDGSCAECKKKDIQRKGEGDLASVPDGFEVAMQRSGAGNPLDSGTRAFMEPRFGQDFGDVRVHTDSASAEAAKLIHAQAFTTGRDIYFGAGRSQAQKQESQKLLAHELTHVVQQRSGAVTPGMSKPVLGVTGDRFEQEADAVAERIVAGESVATVALSSASQSQIQRYSLGEFVEDVQGAASTVGEAAVSVGESVYEGAVAAGKTVASAAESVYEGAVAVGETVVSAGEAAISWVVTTAGRAALSAARTLVSLFGGSVTITPTGIVITIPTIPLFPSFEKTLSELPPVGFFIPLLGGGVMVGPIPIAGAVGILAYAQPSIETAVGPGELRGIRILLNPLTSHYAATAQLYVAAAIAPRLTLFGGLAAAVGTVIPFEPPIPIVAIIQGGLRGTGTGWIIGALQSIVNLEYLAGKLSFDATNNLMLGALLQGDLDLFAALRIGEKIICQYVYPLNHWETGRAWRWTIPITASLGGSSGATGGIGPITSGPMPIQDIETAIHPLPSGWDCLSWQEIERFLCENGYLPPELCEEEEGEQGLGIAGNCIANDNLTEIADNFISRCRKASIRSEFPGELLPETLGNIKKGKSARHKKAWKLLNDNRFKKPGAGVSSPLFVPAPAPGVTPPSPLPPTVAPPGIAADTCTETVAFDRHDLVVGGKKRNIKFRDTKHTRMAQKSLQRIGEVAKANCETAKLQDCERKWCKDKKEGIDKKGQIDKNTVKQKRYIELHLAAWKDVKKVPKERGRFATTASADSDIGFDVIAGALTNNYTVHVELENNGNDFNDTHLFPQK
jgi:hypothetical protein